MMFHKLFFTVALAVVSLYHVPLHFVDEESRPVELSQYQNHFVVITMIYTSCPVACPMIVKKLKTISQELGADAKDVHFVSVTFDPGVDTPAKLLQFKKAQGVDVSNWHFLSGAEEETRKLSLLLDIAYKKIPDSKDFMHDIKILLLDPKGQIVATLIGLDAEILPLLKAMGKSKTTFFQKLKNFFKK